MNCQMDKCRQGRDACKSPPTCADSPTRAWNNSLEADFERTQRAVLARKPLDEQTDPADWRAEQPMFDDLLRWGQWLALGCAVVGVMFVVGLLHGRGIL